MHAVLAFDLGSQLGYAFLADGSPHAGSRQLKGSAVEIGRMGRHCEEVVREIILAWPPSLITFAAPFVGTRDRGRPVSPDTLGPLFATKTVIEMAADALGIACRQIDEGSARQAFLGKIPRGSAKIKAAVKEECRRRGWLFPDDHAADALCVAAYARSILEENPVDKFRTTGGLAR